MRWLFLMAFTIVSNLAVFADATGHGNQSHLVYAPVQQRWWLFNIDTKTGTTVSAYVSSSNDLSTATWSAGTASPAFPNSRALTTNDRRNLGVVMVPNSINTNDAVHVSVSIGTAASGPGYTDHIRAKFTGSSSITWESWNEQADFGGGRAWHVFKGNALGVGTDGSIHESSLVLDTNEDASARKSSNTDTASTWTNAWATEVLIDASMTNQCNAYSFAPLASGEMLCVYDNGGGTEPNSTGCRYNKTVSGAWQTTGSADTGVGSGAIDQNQFSLCGVDTTHIYLFRNSTGTAMNWRKFDGSSWSTPANAVPTFPGTSFLIGSGFLTATDGSSLWLFALDSAGNNALYYVKCSGANGSTPTWGSWNLLESADSAGRNYLSGYPVVSNNQIGVVFTRVNASNFDIRGAVLNVGGTSHLLASMGVGQ